MKTIIAIYKEYCANKKVVLITFRDWWSLPALTFPIDKQCKINYMAQEEFLGERLQRVSEKE